MGLERKPVPAKQAAELKAARLAMDEASDRYDAASWPPSPPAAATARSPTCARQRSRGRQPASGGNTDTTERDAAQARRAWWKENRPDDRPLDW